MSKLLVVVDMQVDFVNGSLGTKEAEAIVENVRKKIQGFEGEVVFTRDTHTEEYLQTQEGRNLPVVHCIKETEGWQIIPEFKELAKDRKIFDKPTFGSVELAQYIADGYQAGKYDSVELIGLCTDICVISNAAVIKAYAPEIPVAVDAACCAGVTPQSHHNALEAMKILQIQC